MYWQSSTQNNVTSLVLHTWTCRRLISVHATRPVQKEQGSSVVMIRAGRYLQHSARTLQHCLITGCSSALIKMYTVQLKCTTKMQWRNTLSTFHFISYILILRTRFSFFQFWLGTNNTRCIILLLITIIIVVVAVVIIIIIIAYTKAWILNQKTYSTQGVENDDGDNNSEFI